MKRNSMRIAALLLVLVLLTTAAVGGTFAKYITRYTTQDSARAAYWGFENSTKTNHIGSGVQINLFDAAYVNDKGATTVEAHNGTDLIYAPGTSGDADITFKYTDSKSGIKAPEVAYTFKLEADFCGSLAAEYGHMTYTLTYGEEKIVCENEEAFVTALGELTGMENVTVDEIEKNDPIYGEYWASHVVAECDYAPGELPEFLENNEKLNIAWNWVFENPENPDDLVWDNDDDNIGNVNAWYEGYDAMILNLNIVAEQID